MSLTKEELQQKFPKMKPIPRPPNLQTLNGFGFGVYGRRDEDIETETYVKTYCFCFVFIPIIALGAYRVADAGSGAWYFIGKEPLSKFALGWNVLLLCAILAGAGSISLGAYYNSPEYLSKAELKIADQKLVNRNYDGAAIAFRTIGMRFPTAQAQAREGLEKSVSQAMAQEGTDLSQLLELYRKIPLKDRSRQTLEQLVAKSEAQARSKLTTEPKVTLKIARSLIAISPEDPKFATLRMDALKSAITLDPRDKEAAVELALEYEKAGNESEARAVLYPLKDQLGDSEGARILGSIFMKEGNPEEAYPLLSTYVLPRLGQLHTAEKQYELAEDRAHKDALLFLQGGHAEPSFYSKLNAASEADQQTLVQERLMQIMNKNGTFQAAIKKVQELNFIVPLALELGIAQVDRAQKMSDPDARKNEFEAAEKTFLAIRSFAGKSDEYQLFLGEVYFWLGKYDEGDVLFEQLLERNKRAPVVLLNISRTLRAVGLDQRSRELSEECYNTSTDKELKTAAASHRSQISTSADDRIQWLQKCDENIPSIKADLNEALGERAYQRGNPVEAEKYFRAALEARKALPKSSARLNNDGISYIGIYAITGNSEDIDKALSLMEEAVSLEPDNSILLSNISGTLISTAMLQTTKDKLRYDLLATSADYECVPFCADSEKEKLEIAALFKNNALTTKGRTCLEKAILLRPKDPSLYVRAAEYYLFNKDLEGLKQLNAKLDRASPDLTEMKQRLMDRYLGKNEGDELHYSQSELARMRALSLDPKIVESPASYRFAKDGSIQYSMALAQYGEKVDAESVLKEAEEFYAKSKNPISMNNLASALMFKVHQQLETQNAEYSRIAEKTRRAIPGYQLLGFLIRHGGPGCENLDQTNPDVQRAAQLYRAAAEMFPNDMDSSDWRNLSGESTAEMKKKIVENQAAFISHEISLKTSPWSARVVLERVADYEVLGEYEKAKAIHTEAVAAGVPLPPYGELRM